jgi:hypothetical protein
MKLLAALFGQFAQIEEQATEVHADATLSELAMSHGDLASLLRTAVRAQHPGPDLYCWVRDVFDTEVIYELSNSADQSRLYRRTYTVDDAGSVTLGEPVAVVATTTYVPVTESSESAPEVITGDLIPLVEKAVKKDGTANIKIIQAGQGSSGYYPAEVLKRDGPKAFTAGTHVYLDHPSVTEESERPERSVKDLAGSLTGPAVWNENGAAGPGLYAPVKFIDSVAPHINAIAAISGMSIRASGTAGVREVDGKKVRSIESIDSAHSIDVVTRAGAGGKVLDLIESARSGTKPHEQERTNDVELTEAVAKIADLEARNATIDQELARLRETNIIRDAHAIVKESLSGVALPGVTRQRLSAALAANPPIKEGSLDKDALTTKIAAAVTAELEYLAEASGVGLVRGMGGGSANDTDPKAELAALFEAAGHSKDVAARMAAR